MGLYVEKNWTKTTAVLVLIAAFLIIYLPWLSGSRELFREESLYAVETVEYGENSLQVTAHGMPVYSNAPLFPAFCHLIWKTTGLPLELVMRGISMLMLAAGAILVYFASASQREPRAGWVAAAFYLTPLIGLEKAVEGTPVTMAAFFLIAAQLLFFYYGMRRSNWTKAWIFSAILLSFGFLAGGPAVIFFFAAPMFFFRRPLSVKSKFNTPGFAAAVLILATIVAIWTVPGLLNAERNLYDIWLDSFLFYKRKYLLDLIEFPLLLPLRLLPWSLIAWLPFCVALQDLDKTPIYSRYLRTLFLVNLVLVWFFNDSESRAIIYLLGPLSILTGISYDLGTRRYGERIRKTLVVCEILVLLLAVAFVAVLVTPENILSFFMSLKNTLSFRKNTVFFITACIGSTLLVVSGIALHIMRKKQPLWSMLLLTVVCCGIFYGGVMNPYRSQIRSKRDFGTDIRSVLPKEKDLILYKQGINDLYGELFYTGVKIRKLSSLKELPQDTHVVYLLSTEFPGTTDRSWTNLLPPDYTYNRHPLLLWKGVLRQNEE